LRRFNNKEENQKSPQVWLFHIESDFLFSDAVSKDASEINAKINFVTGS
jgi:hypothetical protein